MLLVLLKVKVSKVVLNVGTSVLKMLHTVTLYHIVYLVLLVKTKHQVVCLKVKKMAGHLGAERVTVQSLEVVRVDAERKLLLVKVLYLVLSMAMLSLSRQLKHKSRR